jgi:hypothetical protein
MQSHGFVEQLVVRNHDLLLLVGGLRVGISNTFLLALAGLAVSALNHLHELLDGGVFAVDVQRVAHVGGDQLVPHADVAPCAHDLQKVTQILDRANTARRPGGRHDLRLGVE